jgi:hypothetical protein
VRRYLVLTGLLVGVFASAGLAGAASEHDFVAGSLKVTVPPNLGVPGFEHFRVSAHSGPHGEDPFGSVRLTIDHPFLFGSPADLKGDVDCLSISGNIAELAARLRQPHMGFSHVVLLLVDHGNPGDAMGLSPDFATFGFTSSPSPSCFAPSMTVVGETHGNIVVRDAT